MSGGCAAHQQQRNPRSASGARHQPALHRTCQRVFIHRRQGQALRALRGLDGAAAGDGAIFP
ncbi:hypothetical protein D3871_25230 [Noviherbaspirillum saxi]|uniref:Uncharacterized protein n=1 Tax=Noviherbaspirillum saxi TaxID=2320863 RepID=A0A3A3FY16_9BURK|nr:hypothetical protein D3871_25230 [Noviherbaspirillum saxi]